MENSMIILNKQTNKSYIVTIDKLNQNIFTNQTMDVKNIILDIINYFGINDTTILNLSTPEIFDLYTTKYKFVCVIENEETILVKKHDENIVNYLQTFLEEKLDY